MKQVIFNSVATATTGLAGVEIIQDIPTGLIGEYGKLLIQLVMAITTLVQVWKTNKKARQKKNLVN
jgi:hypothetical protein